jgi:tripartite-type tricarboxylate transporter receptor subunit TctC
MTFFARLAAVIACLPIIVGSAATADTYPSKPIRMVVAFAAGGSADINARIVAQQLSTELGRQVVVENKGGAGGNLGAVDVKRSAPDGYTIFYSTSAVVLAPSVYDNPGFDPQKDFTPISLTATIPLVLVVSPKVPATTPAEFVAWAKAQGGNVNYASSGRGALLHLVGALFTKETGIKASHIAYRGSAPAVTDLIGGSTHFMFLPANEAIPQIQGGALRALAVTHSERLPQLPDVPTFRESLGLKAMDAGAWQGLMVPAGTPQDVTARLNGAIDKTLKNEAVRKRIMELGSIMLGGTDKDYADYMKQEGARWAQIVADTGAKAE